MSLPTSWQMFATIQIALFAIWTLPFWRAYHFYSNTKETFLSDGSANSATDFRFSMQILFCYSSSFLIANLLAWLWCRKRSLTIGWCFLLSSLLTLWIAGTEPERVVILLPNFAPGIVLFGHLLLGLISLLAVSINMLRSRNPEAPFRVQKSPDEARAPKRLN